MEAHSPSITAVACTHCGSPVPTGARDAFCCAGCRSVYSILKASGLEDYYRLKEEGVCFTPSRPVTLVQNDARFETTEKNVRFFLEGVHCSACLWLLEKLPRVTPAVESCSLNLGTSVLNVTLSEPSKAAEVAGIIMSWGYVPHLMRSEDRVEVRLEHENRKALIQLGIAGALAGNIMLMSIPLYAGVKGAFEGLFEWASFLLATPSLFYCGRPFFKNVYSGIRSKTFPIDGPILLALLVAYFYSAWSLLVGTHELYFDSLRALIFLLLSSRYYLSRLRQRSRMNLGVLDFFAADFDGNKGDLRTLRSGETVPFDGVVRKGEAWCDLSRFNGESSPVCLKVGDVIQAGSTVASVSPDFLAEVTATGEETRLAGILTRIRDAQSKRTASELKSDRLAKRLLAVVSSVSAFALLWFFYRGMPAEGVKRVLALLIVTCPCALALATPLVFTLAMKQLLRQGLLVKDPDAIDSVPEVKQVFFDKTGTLTEGRLIAGWNDEKLSEADRSALYSMVRLSRHPASKAIERAYADSGSVPQICEFSNFEELPSVGLKADAYELVRANQSSSGLTESVFKNAGKELCRIGFSDRTRPDSAAVIRRIKNAGFGVGLISGDLSEPVMRISDELGIEHASSGMSPEQKAKMVMGALMVGDGVNDAFALSNAKVGIAVQGGMEAAIQSAPVYSLKPGISTIPVFLEMGYRVRRVLIQNFAISTSYNAFAGVLSLTGHMNPLWAAVLMPASALSVFFSSMIRLKERTR